VSSEKQINANRANGGKSKGPLDTSSTRYNATKHGLLAKGITELDDPAARNRILTDLISKKNPVGETEMVLVESAALDLVRWTRAQRLEALFITGTLNPPTYEKQEEDLLAPFRGQMVDPGLPATIRVDTLQCLLLFQRYELFFSNRFYRTLHELERMQRIRHGERLPAPTAVDLSFPAGVERRASKLEVPGESNSQRTLGESLSRPIPVDVTHADDKDVDAVPAQSQEHKLAYADGENFVFPGLVDVTNKPEKREAALNALWQKARPRPIWSQ
jgi:hypothetical protein